MEKNQWRDVEDVGIISNEGYNIKEEVPQVSNQKFSIQFRSFHTVNTEDCRSIGNFHDDAAFRIFKKRRFEHSYRWNEGPNQSVHQTLMHRLVEPFEISQRQHETFQWLKNTPRADEMAARFHLDRVLGAPPCLGAVNRALGALGDEEKEEALKLDILEDVLLDGGEVALSTLMAAAWSLMATQPIRAARIAFTIGSATKDNVYHVPVKLWEDICSHLAEYARSTPGNLCEDFAALFQDAMSLVRIGGGTVTESTIAKFGRSLLNDPRNVGGAVQLVEEELLSGRNEPDSNPSVISLFLSELLRLGCDELAESSEEKSQMAARKAQAAKMVEFSGDVIKYAFARKIQLEKSAFDAILALYDREKNYFGLCIIFTAMCVLSVPTIRSFLRFVEVFKDVPSLSSSVNGILHGSETHFLLWFFRKYGKKLWKDATDFPSQEKGYVTILEGVGELLSLRGQPQTLLELWVTIQPYTEKGAMTLLTSYFMKFRQKVTDDGIGPQELHDTIQKFEVLSNSYTKSLLSVPHPQSSASFVPHCKRAEKESALPIQQFLQYIVSSPQMYCNIITATCLNFLGGSDTYTRAFVRMIEKYGSGVGAMVLMPIDALLSSSCLDPEGRRLAAQWCSHESWFGVLPLSLSAQLKGASSLDICFDLFRHVKAIGHSRVVLIGSEAEGDMAKANHVQPFILFHDLMKKLGA